MRWRGSNPEYDAVTGSTLQEQLDLLKARARSLLQPEVIAIHDRATEEMQASGLAGRTLPVGATAPSFELPDRNGKPVRLAELLAQGRLVVSFFRGRWCPYCIAELEALEAALPRIREAGASLVAISPQTVRQTDFLVDQHKFSFPVLSDAGNRVARAFGLVYEVPAYLRELYQRSFINLPLANGDPSWELPLPATYVLERDATVLYAFTDADTTRRAEPAEILHQLAR
ncbi:MAG: AhpC/TSA family protein [Acidobacteria bacterium]|nr:AhpC/TSA family protein [Acidobacteriota bacterium]